MRRRSIIRTRSREGSISLIEEPQKEEFKQSDLVVKDKEPNEVDISN